jgi:hypothetical protein
VHPPSPALYKAPSRPLPGTAYFFARKQQSKINKSGGHNKNNDQQNKKPTDPLKVQAQAALKRLQAKDPGLKQLLKDAHGYAVFPNVGKAALVLGSSYGRGIVYEQGEKIGFTAIGPFTIGIQIGGDTFAELVVCKDQGALDRFKQGKVRFRRQHIGGARESRRGRDHQLRRRSEDLRLRRRRHDARGRDPARRSSSSTR